MLKQQLLKDLRKAMEVMDYPATDIVLSTPENKAHGDYSTNIALQLSKLKSGNRKHSPQEIAKQILSHLGDLSYLSKAEVVGPGFLNFFIKPEVLSGQLAEILEKGEDFGKNELGKGEKIQVEFISANPTGPLTLANGRGGAIGDTLANVLSWSGYKVGREYYVNDTGNQVRNLGESVLAAAGKAEAKEEHYRGEYIKDLAEKFKDKLDLDPQSLGHLLADYLLDSEIKPAALRIGIKFDEFYSERSLYERNLIEKAAELLKEKGFAYENEGALWFASTKFGDEKDRVLMTSEGGRGRAEPTYFLADIAHHFDVLGRGYLKKINIWGADHHGYETRLKGAVAALGFEGKVDIIFMQMVKLFRGGVEVKMSKRAGTYVTLDELLEAVDKDAARFFFLMYSPESHIDFNLDLAKEQSNKNPVFYVQYAHARMSNILKKAGEKPIDSCKARPCPARPGLAGQLSHHAELDLIKHLVQLPDLVEGIAQDYQVHKLTFYATKLADLFHKFYESCRVLNAETEGLKEARLALVLTAKITLGNTLSLLGVSAPERM